MPCLASNLNPDGVPIIQIGIAPPSGEDPVVPPSQLSLFGALIDTGATKTCISSHCANAIALNPIGKTQMISATEVRDVNFYIGNVIVPFGRQVTILENTQLMEFACDPTSPFQVLLGRDLICKGHFSISFDGRFVFCL